MNPHHRDVDPVAEPTADMVAGPSTMTSDHPGEMQELFSLTDWSATQLGPVESWPARLRTIVDICLSSRFPMLVCWGRDLVMIYNDGYRTLLGSTKHPGAWGRPVRDVWPEIWDVIGPMFDGVVQGGPPTWAQDELLVVDRYGFAEEAYFTWTYGAIHDDSGENVVGILNVATEVTAKVLAERRARVSAELVAALADATSADGVRRRAVDVLGAHTEDHLWVDLVWTDGRGPDAPEVLDELAAAPGEGDGAVHVLPVLEPGLHEPTAHLHLTANPRRPWDGPLQVYAELCASHVAMALSGLRRLREEQHRAEVLTALDTAKTDFFANVSHELRTPLTLIAGPVQDALKNPDLGDEARERFELIRRNTDRLVGLVDRILDLTRVEAGAVEPHWVQVDVREVLTGVAANFRPAIERLGLDFSVELDELDHDTFVDVDMLERVVLNLLSNALKFTPRGGITLRLAADGDGYTVTVTDTGIGIAERDLDLVFDRFRQLSRDDERRSREGAGIGLSLVQQLVALLGGRISVESTEGEGSTFAVALPWGVPAAHSATRPSITPRSVESFISEASGWALRSIDAVDATAAAAVEVEQRPDSSSRLSDGPHAGSRAAKAAAEAAAVARGVEVERPRLLLVEDNADMRDYTARHLAADYDVVPVGDGREALDRMRADPPVDLVLADVMMPRMDGLELVRQIRADERLRDVPVVLLSARAGVEASTTGLLEGADDYVIKPFQPDELRARLASNLVRARSRSRDAAWLRAILGSIQEPVVVSDTDGRVLELNEAFTRAYGWSLADGPLVPPYPWWVSAEHLPDERRAAERRMDLLRAGQPVMDDHYRVLRKGGGESWVHMRAALVPATPEHAGFVIVVARDETRERESRMRRELAARISVDLAAADDLESVLATAVTGFTVLFDGEVSLRVAPERGDTVVLSPRGRVRPEQLPHPVRQGLLGKASTEVRAGEKREGLLLAPTSQRSDCRAWVQFDEPRLVPSDELIVGDLLAQSLGQAVDRVVDRRDSAAKQEQLGQAIESHRLIGQAVGILIERHRTTPVEAFEMLRQASLSRNIKLREIATRVVESGEEPTTA
ncbi:response regulator receiver and ANTAR domain protein [Humibacillus xanthopallidus]|uniref:histidine kinase n=1 Tax=Humibacillus xanthopallidus TaxID=412689 RepID=A0A543PPZ1_9MICO|nr:ATP-binding protein [Humibacillus xanthopallidus]TQN46143.1 response regulator receiver and ANTAR domain protein [Humibacillus xanthopallidus]